MMPYRDNLKRRSLIVGAIALAVCVVWGFFERTQFFVSYLVAWLFFLGIALGSMVNLMVHRLTGGAWGELLLRPLEAAMGALPVIALLGIPLLLGLHQLYPWARPDAVRASDLLMNKAWYLNEPFFVLRAALYFTVWLWLAHRFRVLQSRGDDRRLHGLSIIGLMVYAITVTCAAIDWVMSLTPQWYSTTFGLLTGISQSLAGFACAMGAAGLLVHRGAFPALGAPRVLQDIGNLLLMFVLTWSYLAFTQYLIIWYEDLPPEIDWYVPRLHTSWYAVAWVLIIAHFALPFAILLFRRAKRSAAGIAALGLLMLAAHWIDVLWLVAPPFRSTGLRLECGDLLATLGIGGIAFAAGLHRIDSMQTSEGASPSLGRAQQNG
jgi:hypothetical protein